ncbi:hypothetical protein BOX15_Mlig000837g1 [Macrostomum lignano]|uniref:Uncharacterized protein n=1 Tax=Macrostomum lignano TaxID=282301 RepID=A0A267FHJ2_9PLAT|nr:hypothetical protein BOX15_Mlig000837g1 [Macrostomum lignano]
MDGSNSMHRSALPQWTGVQTDTDSSINSVMSSADDSLRVFSPENVSTEQQPRNRRQQMDEEQYQLYEYPKLHYLHPPQQPPSPPPPPPPPRPARRRIRTGRTHRRRVAFKLRPIRRAHRRGQYQFNSSSATSGSSAAEYTDEETLTDSRNNEVMSLGSVNSQKSLANLSRLKGSVQRPQTDTESESLTVDQVLGDLMKAGLLGESSGATEAPQRASMFQRNTEFLANAFSTPEPRSRVEQSIKDFFRTHRGDSSMRVVPNRGDDQSVDYRSNVRQVKFGMSAEESSRFEGGGGGGGSGAPGGGSGGSTSGFGRGGGHLLKQPIVVGTLNPFDQPVIRQYILPMFDSLMEAFLTNSSLLRAACHQTRCRLELGRRILNRKMLHGSWAKYIPLSISGPSVNAIDCCDKMLRKYVPDYQFRQVYNKEATCCMFIKEDTPDNAELCFSHQRTGMATTKFANLKLESPFLRSETEASRMPWKQGLTKYGRAAVAKGQSRRCVEFVYANAFHRRTGNVPNSCTGVTAITRRQEMQEEATMLRHMQLEEKKRMLLPLSKV